MSLTACGCGATCGAQNECARSLFLESRVRGRVTDSFPQIQPESPVRFSGHHPMTPPCLSGALSGLPTGRVSGHRTAYENGEGICGAILPRIGYTQLVSGAKSHGFGDPV
jgi:hypothetical protein